MMIKYLAAAAIMAVGIASPAYAQREAEGFAMFGDPRVDSPAISFDLSEDVTAPADIARFSISVSTDDDNPEAALRANSQKTAAVISALKAQGVTDGEFKPSRVSVSQRRGSRSTSIKGYTATNIIHVETASVERAPVMMAAAVAAGATETGSIDYDIKDNGPLLSPARERLYKKAEAQARDYARVAGYGRVRPVAVSERIEGRAYAINLSAYDMPAIDAAVEEAAPPAPSTDVTSTIRISFAFRMDK